MYKIEKEEKEGKLTRYIDVEFSELHCPCCHKELTYAEQSVVIGQGDSIKEMSFNCYDCGLHFVGMDDYYQYHGFEDFYNFVKEKLDGISNASSNV